MKHPFRILKNRIKLYDVDAYRLRGKSFYKGIIDYRAKILPYQKYRIKNSTDFFGLNHYTTLYASHIEKGEKIDIDVYGNGGIFEDQYVNLTADKNWDKTEMGWSIVPWGCRKLLEWIDNRYDHPEIYVTENGCAVDDHVVDGKINDSQRIDFLKSYMTECFKAIENGVNLKGYFLWSFMDNFEWALGFSKRFGIHYVDYSTGLRIPKESAKWYQKVIEANGVF